MNSERPPVLCIWGPPGAGVESRTKRIALAYAAVLGVLIVLAFAVPAAVASGPGSDAKTDKGRAATPESPTPRR
jgi:hypothetical protein